MPKFADAKLKNQVLKGFSARKRGVAFTTLHGIECECDLGLLTAEHDDEILEAATARTKLKNGSPKHGDPIFDFACAVERVSRACLDPESPVDAPARFFASADEVRANLDRERINYLAAHQDVLQSSVSPRKANLTDDEWLSITLKLATSEADEASPLDDMPSSTLRIYTRSLAERCVILATSKLHISENASLEEVLTMAKPNSTSTAATSSESEADGP